MTPEAFAIVYDLRDPDAWQAAHRHRAQAARIRVTSEALVRYHETRAAALEGAGS